MDRRGGACDKYLVRLSWCLGAASLALGCYGSATQVGPDADAPFADGGLGGEAVTGESWLAPVGILLGLRHDPKTSHGPASRLRIRA